VTLIWPGLLLLLLLVPALVALYLWAAKRRGRPAVRYSSLSLIAAARPWTSKLRRHLPFMIFLAAVAALVGAMTRPVAVIGVPSGQSTVLLVMDVSRSMCSTDIEPSRLVAAEVAAAEFIRAQPATTQIGIVAFSGFAELIQAPTTDRQLLEDALDSFLTGRRTAVGSGILAAIDAIAEVDPEVAPAVGSYSSAIPPTPVLAGDYAPAIIVVLTDGASNAGVEPADAAQQAADRGLRIFTIGFGTAAGEPVAPLCGPSFLGREPAGGGGGGGGGGIGQGGFRRGIDEDTLRLVAQMTGGQYFPAESASELQTVLMGLPTATIMSNEVVELSVAFVGAGALLTLLAIGLSQRWRPLP
jgi:Ca-activated chloride channel family protein